MTTAWNCCLQTNSNTLYSQIEKASQGTASHLLLDGFPVQDNKASEQVTLLLQLQKWWPKGEVVSPLLMHSQSDLRMLTVNRFFVLTHLEIDRTNIRKVKQAPPLRYSLRYRIKRMLTKNTPGICHDIIFSTGGKKKRDKEKVKHSLLSTSCTQCWWRKE